MNNFVSPHICELFTYDFPSTSYWRTVSLRSLGNRHQVHTKDSSAGSSLGKYLYSTSHQHVSKLHTRYFKGGSIENLESTLSDIQTATVAFQASVTDPKAGLIMTYNYVPSIQQVSHSDWLF